MSGYIKKIPLDVPVDQEEIKKFIKEGWSDSTIGKKTKISWRIVKRIRAGQNVSFTKKGHKNNTFEERYGHKPGRCGYCRVRPIDYPKGATERERKWYLWCEECRPIIGCGEIYPETRVSYDSQNMDWGLD